MRRRLFLVAIAAMSVCVMMACGSKSASNNDSAEQAESADEVGSGENGDPKTEQAVIDLLEEAYFDVNTIIGPRDEEECEPSLDLSIYCSKEFNRLRDKILAIEAKKADGSFALYEDWNRMWSFWETGPVTPKDFQVDIDGDTANVTFNLTHGDESATQEVMLIYEDGQWHLNDWLQRGIDADSHLERMREYIEENL